MAAVRFAFRDDDQPVSGALHTVPVYVGDVAASTTVTVPIPLPTGMKAKITDVLSQAGAVTGAPTIKLGTTAGGAEIVAAVSPAATRTDHTIVAGTVSANSTVYLTVTTGAGESITGLSVVLALHSLRPPTSILARGAQDANGDNVHF